MQINKILKQKYPMIADLRKRARQRLPHLAYAYLETGTGIEQAVQRNRDGFAEITMLPRFMKGELEPDITARLFGQTYKAPFGIAPVGLSGLIWPQAECYLAQTAVRHSIPYSLSTVASETPETVGKFVGQMGWFQLYPPREPGLRQDLLNRAKANGFHTLVVTVDVPIPSQREQMTRAGLSMPPVITPRFIAQALKHPAWTIATLRHGLPRLKIMEKYARSTRMSDLSAFVTQQLGNTLTWDYLQAVRDEWQGPLVLKGILHPGDTERAVAIGVDGIQVSNHGGRQFDGAPAAIQVLPTIVRLVNGKAAVLFDSGIRTGLDIVRALALGADFVFLGRAYMYGLAALGRNGGDYVTELLMADMKNNMTQLGVTCLDELRSVSISTG